MDSGFYAACAGLRAKSEALDVIANNVANLNSTGYSSAQVDKRKIGQLAVAIQTAFQEMGVFSAPSSQAPKDVHPKTALQTLEKVDNATAIAVLARKIDDSQTEDLSKLMHELQETLGPELQRNEVALRSTNDGLIISLREIGFFETGSAEIRGDSLPAFGRIATLLSRHSCRIRIEGHTDNVPIHNSRFTDNWELSTARSTKLVRLLITKYGYASERLSAAGYAEYHPVASNDSPDTRAQNRRVDIVVLGRFGSEVTNSLPAENGSRLAHGDTVTATQ